MAAQRLGGGRRVAAQDGSPSLLSRLARQASGVRPVKVLTVGVFSVMLVGIVANAVLFQKSRHPAPLFGSNAGHAAPAAQREAPAKAVAAAEAPVPAAAQITPEASVPASPAPAKRAASKPQHEDGIGRLLRAGTSGEPASAPERKPDAALLSTQRHLAKLGYAVKADGFMSPATRAAVETFERDRHLKAGVALTPALRREIATAAAPEAAPKVQ